MKKNRVYAGIDLDALRYNMESMHKNIKEGTKIAAVIKQWPGCQTVPAQEVL